MNKYYKESSGQNASMEQQMVRKQYDALVDNNYSEKVKSDGYDPLSIEEKMKNLRFAK